MTTNNPIWVLKLGSKIGGGTLFKWRAGRALEDELFQCLPDEAVLALLAKAEAFLGTELIDSQIKSLSGNALNLSSCKAVVTPNSRAVMAQASKVKNNSWYKTVSHAEEIGLRGGRTASRPERPRLSDHYR